MHLVALAAASFVSGAHAHHSTALVYDRDGALIEAEGVITEVAWVEPARALQDARCGRGRRRAPVGHRIELRQHREPLRPDGRARRRRQPASRLPATAGGRPTTSSGSRTCCCRAARRSCSARQFEPRWSQQTIGSDIRSAVDCRHAEPRPLPRVDERDEPARVLGPADLPLTASAAAARAAFDPLADEPTQNCAPKGMPYIMEQPYPIEFVKDGDDILLRMEEYDTVRRITMSTAAPQRHACDAARRLVRPLGRRNARRDDDEHRLPLVQRHRHSARARRGDRRSGSR